MGWPLCVWLQYWLCSCSVKCPPAPLSILACLPDLLWSFQLQASAGATVSYDWSCLPQNMCIGCDCIWAGDLHLTATAEHASPAIKKTVSRSRPYYGSIAVSRSHPCTVYYHQDSGTIRHMYIPECLTNQSTTKPAAPYHLQTIIFKAEHKKQISSSSSSLLYKYTCAKYCK